MIFEWFNTTEVDALADRLAGDLAKRVPPASIDATGKKAESQQTRSRDMMLRQVQDFASKHPLNVFKKARLANRFKWALIEAGYPRKFVDDMAFELAAVVATTKKRPA